MSTRNQCCIPKLHIAQHSTLWHVPSGFRLVYTRMLGTARGFHCPHKQHIGVFFRCHATCERARLGRRLCTARPVAEGFVPRPPLCHARRVQLWGAALPLNSPKVPCILDPAARVGVCGDWLTGASLQSAWLSGRALADRLAALRGRSLEEAQQLAIGLQDPFVPLAEATASAAEIGEFPGCKVPAASPQQQRRPQQQHRQQRQPQQQRARADGAGNTQGPRKEQQQRQPMQQRTPMR